MWLRNWYKDIRGMFSLPKSVWNPNSKMRYLIWLDWKSFLHRICPLKYGFWRKKRSNSRKTGVNMQNISNKKCGSRHLDKHSYSFSCSKIKNKSIIFGRSSIKRLLDSKMDQVKALNFYIHQEIWKKLFHSNNFFKWNPVQNTMAREPHMSKCKNSDFKRWIQNNVSTSQIQID